MLCSLRWGGGVTPPRDPFCTDVPLAPSSGGERPAHPRATQKPLSAWLRGCHLWAAGVLPSAGPSAVFAASQPSVPSCPDPHVHQSAGLGSAVALDPFVISEALYASWPHGPRSQDRCLTWGRAGRSGWHLGGERPFPAVSCFRRTHCMPV